MKTTKKSTANNTQVMAEQIWEDVVASMNEYTDDNVQSKFFLREELTREARSMAASFSLLHYSPLPTMKEIYRSKLYGLFLLSILCGMQVCIKERAINTNNTPYTLTIDGQSLRKARNDVTRQLAEGIKIFSPLTEVMDIFLNHLLTPKRITRLDIRNKAFDNEKFMKFMPVTLLWGYLFTKAIVMDSPSQEITASSVLTQHIELRQ